MAPMKTRPATPPQSVANCWMDCEMAASGGAVTVTMNGKKELLKIKIDPSAVASLTGANPDVEMLETLIVGAVNDAGHKADEAIQSSLKGALGGLNIPGLG